VVVAAVGTMTFVTPDGEVTASAGDLMTVPPGAVHTFKNASETEDCECYMTATPGKITCNPCCLRDREADAGATVGHYVDCELLALPNPVEKLVVLTVARLSHAGQGDRYWEAAHSWGCRAPDGLVWHVPA
jgi:hypothetical protein